MSPYPNPSAWRSLPPDGYGKRPAPAQQPQEPDHGIHELPDGSLVIKNAEGKVVRRIPASARRLPPPIDRRELDAFERFK